MIQSFPFENDEQILGITVGALDDLISRQGKEQLCKPHRVEFYALMLITEGNGFHYIDNKMYHCRPGTLFVLSPHQVHYFDSKFPWKGYIITFLSSEVFPVDSLDANHSVIKSMRNVDVITDVLDLVGTEFSLLYDEHNKSSDMITGRVQRNLLQVIVYKIFYRTSHNEQNIVRSREIEDFQLFSDAIERQFTEKHNASEYADELGMTVRRLNTLCQKVKGSSAKKIIDARLLLEAKRLVGYSATPITEIAVTLGFQEPTNLAKFFRRHTDISPTEFRNMSQFVSKKGHL